VDWLRCAVLLVASVPSAARRGAASDGTVLVAKTKPPRAAKSKIRFMCKLFPEQASPESRFGRF
jgi:hypothetical protein